VQWCGSLGSNRAFVLYFLLLEAKSGFHSAQSLASAVSVEVLTLIRANYTLLPEFSGVQNVTGVWKTLYIVFIC